MILLKNRFLLFFACSILFLTSCNKDDSKECIAPDIVENIVGTWKQSGSGDVVEFKANGTYIDTNDALFSGIGGTFSFKSYEIIEDLISLKITKVGDTITYGAAFSIVANRCDEIKLIIIGSTSTLTRQ